MLGLVQNDVRLAFSKCAVSHDDTRDRRPFFQSQRFGAARGINARLHQDCAIFYRGIGDGEEAAGADDHTNR